MNYLFSIILGIVQGLTEFLPVSSSGHLVVLHDFLNFELGDNLTFDVALHLGTLVSLLFFFYKDIIRYLRAFLKSLIKWNLKNDSDQKVAWLILISMIPAVFAGLFLEVYLESVFRSAFAVALILIGVSFLFFLAEKYSKKNTEFKNLNWFKTLIIGVAQAVALIPGVSRSGITIITGMAYNLKREEAARFSFLISIPIVFAASVKKVYDTTTQPFLASEIYLYVLGFLFSAVIGYFCIKYFLIFLKKYSLNYFAYYRIILGLIILAILFLK